MSHDRSVEQRKRQIRRRMRGRRQRLSDIVARQAADAVCDRLRRRWPPSSVEHLAGYAALKGELDVGRYLERCLRRGGAIYFPRVTGPQTMEFCRIDDFDQLAPGSFGIDEPTTAAVDTEVIDLFLVPGLAFDGRGHRLGFGKGFYDRALPPVGEALAVGVAYDWQIVDRVPVDDHDRRMDVVVTDDDCYGRRAQWHPPPE